MMGKQSAWMRGLLHAEKMADAGLSLIELEQHIDAHIFNEVDEFDRGALDYLTHAHNQSQQIRTEAKPKQTEGEFWSQLETDLHEEAKRRSHE